MSGEAYSSLARFYDGAIGVDYQIWVTYLLRLCLRHGHIPSSILDLGCGTGNLTLPLAQRGYHLTGVDLSPAMIKVAREKSKAHGLEIPFITQDIRELNLPNSKYTTVLSACDVLNYLTRLDELKEAFQGVYRHLEQGGLWLFDVNSEDKLRTVYGNQSIADLQSDFAYFWDNQYFANKGLCRMELTFFSVNSQGLYERSIEVHWQKLWRPAVLEVVARNTGFEVMGCYNFLSTSPWDAKSERWQFVLKKN